MEKTVFLAIYLIGSSVQKGHSFLSLCIFDYFFQKFVKIHVMFGSALTSVYLHSKCIVRIYSSVQYMTPFPHFALNLPFSYDRQLSVQQLW